MSVIYNKELTEYSACVHMLANQQQCKDIIQAFILVSIITRIVLNCTEEVFNKIIDNDKFTNIFDFPETEPFIQRLKEGLKHKNIGVLYFIIVFGLPENSYLNPIVATKGVQESIKKLGIDIEFITKSAINHIEKNTTKLIESSISSIVQIAESAKTNFKCIKISSPILEFDKLHLPKVILGDSTEVLIFNNKNNSLAELDLDKCFDELAEGESWVRRFSEGCI